MARFTDWQKKARRALNQHLRIDGVTLHETGHVTAYFRAIQGGAFGDCGGEAIRQLRIWGLDCGGVDSKLVCPPRHQLCYVEVTIHPPEEEDDGAQT